MPNLPTATRAEPSRARTDLSPPVTGALRGSAGAGLSLRPHSGARPPVTHREGAASRLPSAAMHSIGAARSGDSRARPESDLSAGVCGAGAGSDVVLVVDDRADNLALLQDTLEESGYGVLVAPDGESALKQAARARPDIILLDVGMPVMDGFEVARRLKAEAATAHIPIVFMTPMADSDGSNADPIEAVLEAGGVDMVTKPLRPREVLARMAVHLRGARLARQTRNALDAFGYASITVRARDGRLMWQTALARDLLAAWYPSEVARRPDLAPQAVVSWLRRHLSAAEAMVEPPRLQVETGTRRLCLRLHRRTGDADEDSGGEWLIVMREESDAAVIEALRPGFGLTAREAEVLYWVAKGKINRDIAEIVGASPATVKKHLERVFAKLGVETRTAAAAMALDRIGQLSPQAGAGL